MSEIWQSILDFCKNYSGLFTAMIAVTAMISSITAIFTSYNTVRLWRKTNRPIISALVNIHSDGNIATLFNLAIINTGNRPAINIQLTVDYEKLEKCFADNYNREHPLINEIYRIFSDEGIIPLLVNGEKVSNGFGLTSLKQESNIWVYGSSFPIQINYKDLEGNSYLSKLTLYIKDDKNFAGTFWAKNTKQEEKEIISLLKKLQKIINSGD